MCIYIYIYIWGSSKSFNGFRTRSWQSTGQQLCENEKRTIPELASRRNPCFEHGTLKDFLKISLDDSHNWSQKSKNNTSWWSWVWTTSVHLQTILLWFQPCGKSLFFPGLFHLSVGKLRMILLALKGPKRWLLNRQTAQTPWKMKIQKNNSPGNLGFCRVLQYNLPFFLPTRAILAQQHPRAPAHLGWTCGHHIQNDLRRQRPVGLGAAPRRAGLIFGVLLHGPKRNWRKMRFAVCKLGTGT